MVGVNNSSLQVLVVLLVAQVIKLSSVVSRLWLFCCSMFMMFQSSATTLLTGLLQLCHRPSLAHSQSMNRKKTCNSSSSECCVQFVLNW